MPASPALLSTLARYVPAQVARRLADDPTPLTAPRAEQFPAAVFFADISGFTPLAERLAHQGPAGTEELRRLLNVFFDQLINLITAHGGDVVKFAGDALLAVWPAHGREETLTIVTLRAAQCGLVAQMLLNNYPVADDWKLFLRVSVGAGEVLAADVGGERGRWEFLLTGTPVAQVGPGEKQAERGEVVLSPQAWALVQNTCSGQPLQKGYMRLDALRIPLSPRPAPDVPDLPAASEFPLKAYIPAAIAKRLDAGQTGWLAELRRVTVLFVQIIGLEESAALSLDKLQTVLQTLQTTLYKHEGSVRQFIVDDKGAVLIGVLGLPPLSHEDDAARGAQAALAMQAELAKLGLASAIGVTTGRAFCGTVGSETRHEYAVVGDVVNLAARLMGAAQPTQSILCDAVTYHAASARVAFEALPAIPIKGKAGLVLVYRPTGVAQAAPRDVTTLVGRASERHALSEQMEMALRGEPGGIVIVEGEPGIGKSRLMDDLLDQARRVGLPAFVGAGDAIDRGDYHAWRAIFTELLKLDPGIDPDIRRDRFWAALAQDPELVARAPLLSAWLKVGLSDDDSGAFTTASLMSQTRAESNRALLLSLLRIGLKNSPALLILEDAHWLDTSSWALTLALSQWLAPRPAIGLPIVLVIATRPLSEPVPLEYRRLLDLATTRYLRLSPLPPADSLALVRQRLGVTDLPEAVAALIQARAEGHPFFTEELTYALRDSGLLLIAEGRCQLTRGPEALNALAFPDTVQGIITSRIDRLAPAHQLALKVASVIGRTFVVQLLHDVYPIEADKEEISGILQTLEQLDLIIRESGAAFSFKHVIIQETAYNLMLFKQRRDLHRAIAEWHERVYPHDLAPYYSLLAYHWRKAEDAAKAANYLEHAGVQALLGGAYQEAASFFGEAVELGQTAPVLQRARWERHWGEALYGLGRIVESRAHLEQAVALLGYRMPSAQWELALTGMWQGLRQVLPRLVESYLPSRAPKRPGPGAQPHRAPANAALVEAVRAYERLGVIHYINNNGIAGLYAAARDLNLAERLGPSPELARGYAAACVAAGVFSAHRVARRYRQLAQATMARIDDPDSAAQVASMLGIYEIGVGEWAEAEASLEKAIKVFDWLGNRRDWGNNLVALCWVRYFRGQFARGEKMYADLGEVARTNGNVEHQAWALSGQAAHALRLGHTEAAISLWQKAFPLLESVTVSRLTETLSYGGLAVAHLRQGDFELARHAADSAHQLLRQARTTGYPTFEGYAGAAEVYLALWEAETQQAHGALTQSDLRALATRSSEMLWRYAKTYPIGMPRALLFKGLADWLEGAPADAVKHWQTGLAEAERLGMPYEQGLAHYEIGRHVVGDERQHHLARARELFKQLGAAFDLARAQAEADQAEPFSLAGHVVSAPA